MATVPSVKPVIKRPPPVVRAALLSGYGTCSFFLISPVKGSATTRSVSFRAMYFRDAPLMMPLAFFRTSCVREISSQVERVGM